MRTVLEAKDLWKSFELTKAVQGISLTVYANDFIAVLGKSGSGKTTLFHILDGITRPDRGEVYVAGQNISRMRKRAFVEFRRKNMGYVFQDFKLIPEFSVVDNITFPVDLDREKIDEFYLNLLLEELDIKALKDRLVNHNGEKVKLSEPVGDELPLKGFEQGNEGYIAPHGAKTEIRVKPDSQRLQLLTPFPAWDGQDLLNMPLLIKAQGKCTTDHISMAGPWLRFRGHLENISDNMLMGAVNVFNGETNRVWNRSTNTYGTVSGTAKMYKSEGIPSIVVAEENYGEGSSREHAAMEPRFLNVRVILAKSFARIHETNLKKQGMLALTFVDKADYDKIREHDLLSVSGLVHFAPGRNLTIILHHEDGTKESFEVQHTYNEQQIAWFRAGSALNAR